MARLKEFVNFSIKNFGVADQTLGIKILIPAVLSKPLMFSRYEYSNIILTVEMLQFSAPRERIGLCHLCFCDFCCLTYPLQNYKLNCLSLVFHTNTSNLEHKPKEDWDHTLATVQIFQTQMLNCGFQYFATF